ncbi:MAG: TetR/AcrR family transcriptional regulator [Clostridia bacterium]|nr:TetR/AcrR family transcriptional regulator [Clostridia bacterium]
MPRSFMFTKEEIVAAAVQLTREKGIDAVSARSLGEKLGASSRPIFSYFKSMDEVKEAIAESAAEIYNGYIETEIKSGRYSSYKANCMAYIRFAKEEKELFKMLFLTDTSSGDSSDDSDENEIEEVKPLVKILQKQLNFSRENAELFFSETWVTVHGIAAMLATNDLDWTDSYILNVLNDVFTGIKYGIENRP